VLASRAVRENEAIRRRRECLRCGRRFTTYEEVEDRRVMVVKADGRREPFEREKILRGLRLACMKRPVSTETLERIVEDIEREITDSGEREIAAAMIGERVVETLRGIDPVAYVRFASVYRNFQDITQFGEIVDRLRLETRDKRRRARRLTT